MECPDNHVINVLKANYGRTVSGDVCVCKAGQSIAAGNCPTDPNHSNVDNCFSSDSLSILNNRCNGKAECTVDVNNAVFGEPCGGIHKYLELKYECSETGILTSVTTYYIFFICHSQILYLFKNVTYYSLRSNSSQMSTFNF